MANTMTVSTLQYEKVHGKAPRGNGRWMFQLYHGPVEGENKFFDGPYSECKALAVEYAFSQNASRISVLP